MRGRPWVTLALAARRPEQQARVEHLVAVVVAVLVQQIQILPVEQRLQLLQKLSTGKVLVLLRWLLVQQAVVQALMASEGSFCRVTYNSSLRAVAAVDHSRQVLAVKAATVALVAVGAAVAGVALVVPVAEAGMAS